MIPVESLCISLSCSFSKLLSLFILPYLRAIKYVADQA